MLLVAVAREVLPVLFPAPIGIGWPRAKGGECGAGVGGVFRVGAIDSGDGGCTQPAA